MRPQQRRPRYDILYVEGPGDIVAAFRSWQSGHQHASETSVTFSSQVFAYCAAHGKSLMALSYCPRPASVAAPGFAVENLPRRMLNVRKVGYHTSLIWYALRLGWRVARHRPRMVVVTSGVTFWGWARLWRLGGTAVVPVLHNALWPEGFKPARPRDVSPWRSRKPPWTLVVSPAIRRQLKVLNPKAADRAIEFRPAFNPAAFEKPEAPDAAMRPFRVLYAGRLEVEKGALDLVEIAAQLEAIDPGGFHFDICGDGTQKEQLVQRIRSRGLDPQMTLWGRLDRSSLIERYRASHACIVPTRSNFSEGYAQVVAESILLERPVVTSRVVPASELLSSAIEFATTDDQASFATALKRLRDDSKTYARLQRACSVLRPSILDGGLSFANALAAVGDRVAR